MNTKTRTKREIQLVTHGRDGYIGLSDQALELIVEALHDLKDDREKEIEKNKRLNRGLFCLEKDVVDIDNLIVNIRVKDGN